MLVAAAMLAAVAGGVVAVASVVVLLGVAAVVDGSRLLARAGTRPVLPAAVLPVVALPTTAAGDAAAAWARAGSWYAATFLLAALLLLISGRRSDALRGLGGTMVLAGLVGLGSGALVLVVDLQRGTVWLVALVLLALASDLPDRVMRVRAQRRGLVERPLGRLPLAAAAAATVFVGAALTTALAELLWPPVVVGTALVTLAAGRASAVLWPPAPARPDDGTDAAGADEPAQTIAPGAVLAATGTLLLAAPVAYLVVRAGVG